MTFEMRVVPAMLVPASFVKCQLPSRRRYYYPVYNLIADTYHFSFDCVFVVQYKYSIARLQ